MAKLNGPDLDPDVEFRHPNIWQRESGDGWARLVVGPRAQEVSLLLELCRGLRGPFGLLYILVVPRGGHEAGRYQSPRPLEFSELETFLTRFRPYLEEDGRHHVWVSEVHGDGMLILDRHNLVFAYGDLDEYEATLRMHGFTEAEVRTPSPHAHQYHTEYDEAESQIVGYWDWRRSPLQPSDE